MIASNSRGELLPESVAALARRVEAWRGARTHRAAPMPAELWQAAAALAARHGVYRISSALRVSYGTLKLHTAAGSAAAAEPRRRAGQSFVEVVGFGVDRPCGEAETELELVSVGGARLRLHHRGGGLELPEVIEAFGRSSR